jgi:hypothetical protein
LLDFEEVIASDAFAQRARHPDFPQSFTRSRKLPLPALIATLLTMRSGSQQALVDTFFTQVLSATDHGGDLYRGVSDRAFAKARSTSELTGEVGYDDVWGRMKWSRKRRHAPLLPVERMVRRHCVPRRAGWAVERLEAD